MLTERFTKVLLALTALLLTVVHPSVAEPNDGDKAKTEPYSIEQTHDGGNYKVRFTIEGAIGIAASSQSTDYVQLEGHAAPNGIITVTMEWVECNGSERDLQLKMIDVLMGNQVNNGDAERSDDEKLFAKSSTSIDNSLDRVVYTFNCADFRQADPSTNDSVLMVTAFSTVQLGSNVTETHVYLKLTLDGNDGLHYEEDNKANDKGGAERYIIPVIIGGVLIGGAEWLRRRRKNKKQNEGDDEGNDDADTPEFLEMEFYKDFGDTVVAGDAPQRVSACIVRHPADGPEYVDKQLTSKIHIFADDGYTAVEEEGIINGWKCALVQAPNWETPPEEAVVQFRVASAEASYTNRIHFKVKASMVVFGQENLTLPACYQKEVRLPFYVQGIEGSEADVTVIIHGKERSNADYNVKTEWDTKDQLWNAVITDLWQDVKENEQYMPGDFLTYYIDVEAKSKGGLVVKGRLPLYRFYMGLAFQIDSNDVGCYLDEYDPVHHADAQDVVKMDDKEYAPAETRCSLRLFDYDKDKNQLIVINPVVSANPDDFKVTALDKSNQEQVDKLGLQLVIRSSAHGTPSYRLRCRRGVLNAPNRINAVIEVKSHIGGVELTFKRVVRLLSQPRPSFKSAIELAEWQKEQNRIRDVLENIDNKISVQGLGDRLAPLVQYIQLQLEAYQQDDHFGFDRRNVKAIQKTYHNVLEGEQGNANQHTLVACDNLEEVCWEFFKSMRTTINDMGTFPKLFASVATFGAFDLAVGAIEVVGEMKDYVDKGGNSVFGAFTVGAWKVTKTYLVEKAMSLGTSMAKNYWKSGGDIKNTWNLTKTDAKNLVLKEINSVKEFGKKFQAADNAKARNAQSAKKADELLNEAKKNPLKNSEYSDEAIKYGRKRAQKNLKELQDSIDALKNNPTEANLMRRNEAIIRCQQDKQTMMMLKGQSNIETIAVANNNVNFGECRKVLNNHLDKVYKATDKRVQQRLSKLQPGLKPDEVIIYGATTSDKAKLLSGKSVTFDRDITYYYMDKVTGNKVYFPQRITQQIYAEEFYEVAKLGTSQSTSAIMKATNDAAREFAKKMDQTVVQDVLRHSESYGVDLPKMINKALQGQKLTNPEKVAEAVLYKGQERFYIAQKLMKAAEKAGNGKLDLQASAISELMEGCRQQVKVFDLLDARDIARLGTNGGSMISGTLRNGIAVLRKLAVDGSTDVKTAQSALNAIGLTYEEITKEMYRTVLKIG